MNVIDTRLPELLRGSRPLAPGLIGNALRSAAARAREAA